MYQVDLNCDLGESFGAYQIGMDDKVIPYITSANIACGMHASDPVVMEKTVAMAKAADIEVGAHPGFPDLVGFGRRNMNLSVEEVKAYVKYQIGALNAFCMAEGVKLQHVKPHGALYNMAGKDYSLARAICEGMREVDDTMILLGLSGSQMIQAAKDTNLKVAKEVFADRAYEEDGSLVPRNKEGAMIAEEELAVSRVISIIKNGKVKAITGKEIEITAESVCIHGDGKKALAFAQKIREAMLSEGIQIVPLKKIVK